MSDNIVFLDEGINKLMKYPQCESSNFQWLPDVLCKNGKTGRVITKRWNCHNCMKQFVQVEIKKQTTKSR